MSETRICPFCGKETDKFIMFRGDIVGCRYCGISKKQTNADRIRSMSDEELATWLCDVAGWLPTFEGRVHPILEWLRQEAEK